MAKMVSLQIAVEHLAEKLTMSQIAKVLGTTVNQVYKYKTGYTKTCSDKVIDAMYDTMMMGDEPILIDVFNNEAEYLHFRQIRESVKD